MDVKRIYCDVIFELYTNDAKGQDGIIENYDENVGVDEYKKRFERHFLKTNGGANKVKSVTVRRIEISTHDKEGNYITDDRGDTIRKTIYGN